MKKFFSLLLALAMTMSLAAMPALAAEEAVEVVETVEAAVPSGKIVGFAPFDVRENALTLSSEARPSEEQLVERMPKTLGVVLEDGQTVTIPVEWFCITEDYAEGKYFHYQFSPKWDESAYQLDEGIDLFLDAPYISVTFAESDESELSAQSVCSPAYAHYETQAFQFLVGVMGLTQAQACGIMANIYAECGFKPNNLQQKYETLLHHTDDSYTAAVSNGTYSKDSFVHDSAGYGLLQWTFYTLKEHLYDFAVTYAKTRGLPMNIGDMTMQLECLRDQLENGVGKGSSKDTFNNVLKTIKTYPNTAQGAYNAASIFCRDYERPDKLEARKAERGNYAKDKYWPQYWNATVTLTMTPPALPNTSAFLTNYLFEYDGTAKLPTVDPTMTQAVDFTPVYENNVNVGMGSVKLVGVDGQVQDACQFAIMPRPLGKTSVGLSSYKVSYTGKAIYVEPVVRDTIAGTAVQLVKNRDYIVAYQKNTAIGNATVMITGVGNYTGTVTCTFQIVPKTTVVSSAASKKSKKITVKWKKNSSCTGYQIQVATDPNFTQNLKKKTVSKYKTTSYTFSKLKKKTKYYVRMRAYKKASGVTYYTDWVVYGKLVKTK